LTITITAGLIIFNLKKVDGIAETSGIGIMLVVASLLLDGISVTQ